MKAVFRVKTIKSDWKPPFRKEIKEEDYTVSENEVFDRIVGNGNDEPIFQLEQIGGGRAKVRYSRVFMVRGQPEGQEKDKRVWLNRESPVTFTYLWGEKGISKVITYMGVATKEEESIDEQAKELVEIAEAAPVIWLEPPGTQ